MDQRYIGKAGEYRVMSELMLRGFNPSLVSIDSGVDIILADNGKRLQIKTAELRTDGVSLDSSPEGTLRYVFATRKSYYRNGKKDQNRKHLMKEYKSAVDFFICYGITDDSFYIIPIKDVPESTISIYPKRENKLTDGRPSKYQKYESAWYLLEEK